MYCISVGEREEWLFSKIFNQKENIHLVLGWTVIQSHWFLDILLGKRFRLFMEMKITRGSRGAFFKLLCGLKFCPLLFLFYRLRWNPPPTVSYSVHSVHPYNFLSFFLPRVQHSRLAQISRLKFVIIYHCLSTINLQLCLAYKRRMAGTIKYELPYQCV